jgi:hypothetical protein
MDALTRCFTLAKAREFFGHLLDGHIIHLLSKPLLHNIGKGQVETNCLEFSPGNDIHLDNLLSPHIGNEGLSGGREECVPNKFEDLPQLIPPVPD